MAVCGNPESAAYQLAEIYCVSEQYGLEDLKTLTVKKLSDVTNAVTQVSAFLHVARRIYERTPDSDVTYCKVFKDKLYEMEKPSQMSELDRQTFDDCISGGGCLAIDMVASLSSKYGTDLSNVGAQLSRRAEVNREQKAKYYADIRNTDALLVQQVELTRQRENELYQLRVQQDKM